MARSKAAAKRSFALLARRDEQVLWHPGDGAAMVVETFEEQARIEDERTAEFLESCVEITGVSPAPTHGWTYDDGGFSAPTAYEPTPAQRMAAAVNAGFEVRSTVTPALDATYDAAGPRWQRMKDEAAYIREFDAFSGGATSLAWPAASGEVTFTSPDQLRAVRRAIEDRLTAWQRFADGQAAAPTGPVEIT